ncbi:hypothetical protein GPOL_c07040 [Gordonia polyisoprenivorans VH2]|uniref:Uncharacterized protein n=1 Tax=Gordonia polyisoprenivorans (strain DSM 44266 / VH2) TaxID=1112204 RepID=H6MWW7_GORPV|nr:hypothetical protein [Gordonia polyisoprenivorans]AFA71773.1 hypothetical protein GPOL_c07040 [Gordonia polyisoprenivorans VH2]
MTVVDHYSPSTCINDRGYDGVEMETVDQHGHIPGHQNSAYQDALDDDDARTAIAEREFLTAILWSPPSTTTAVVHAILGAPDQRTTQPLDDVLPDLNALFVNSIHASVFAAIAAMVDENQPVTPALVLARLDTTVTSRRHRHLHRSLLLELTAPAGYSHPHHGAVLPHLAVSLIEAWYRRGYIRFIDRMRHGMTDLPTTELPHLRDDLLAMSRAADTRMLAITERLARI